jgi:hypothetical protein
VLKSLAALHVCVCCMLQARAYLLSAGFSLAFGSMFTKTYRVHRIFTTSRSGVVKNKVSLFYITLAMASFFTKENTHQRKNLPHYFVSLLGLFSRIIYNERVVKYR